MNKQLLQVHRDQGEGVAALVAGVPEGAIHPSPAVGAPENLCGGSTVVCLQPVNCQQREGCGSTLLLLLLLLQVKTCQGRPKAVIALANLHSPLKTVCTPHHSNASMIV